MTLQQLEYVVALDTHRHFVEAAEHCFVTQPTLTMQLKKLEDEIGFQLFDRSRKPLVPTRAGEEVIRYARRILRESNALKAYVNNEKDRMDGHFRLGVIPTLAPYLLPKFLPAFAKTYPKTRLEIYEMQTEQIIERLHEDSLELGLLVTSLGDPEIREIPLFHEPFLIYHPKNHPVFTAKRFKAEQLDTSRLLILNEGHCFRDQTLSICDTETDAEDIGFDYQSGSIEGLMQMVRQGIGYTLIPELAMDPTRDNEYITRFSDPEPVREVSLVVHQGFIHEALIIALGDAIRACVPQEWATGNRFRRIKWRG